MLINFPNRLITPRNIKVIINALNRHDDDRKLLSCQYMCSIDGFRVVKLLSEALMNEQSRSN